MDSQEGDSEEIYESPREEYEWQPFDRLKSEGEQTWMEGDQHARTNENERELHLKKRGERKFKKCSKADRLKFKAYAVPLKMPSLIPKPLFKPTKQLIEKKRRMLISQLSQQRTLRYKEDNTGKVAPVNSPQIYYKTSSSFKFPSQSIHTLQTAELKNTTLETVGKDVSDPMLRKDKLTSSCKLGYTVVRNAVSRNCSVNKPVDQMTSKYLQRGIHFKQETGGNEISPIGATVTQSSFVTLSSQRVEVKPSKVKPRVFPSNSLLKKTIRVFLFNSQDTYIRRILQDYGWVLNPSLSSQHYHLKWNYLPNLADYTLKQGQFYNHMKNSHQLTSKAYLSKNLRAIRQNYYPKCYDIARKQEKEEFVAEFVREFMMSLLNQIYTYVRTRRPTEVSEYEQFYRNILIEGQYDQSGKGHSVFAGEGFRSICLEDYKHFQEDFTLHGNLLITAMRYWRRIRKKHDIDYQSQPHFLLFNLKQFQDQQWQMEKYRKNLHGCRGATGFEKEFYSTPSLIAIERIVKEWVYFSQSNLYGDKNIWIIKPSNSSRGNGITLESDLTAILTSSKGIQSKLIQRYIEKPLLFGGASLKKFDIRQWVLLKSLEPLQIYMFSHFYVRICSEEYQLNQIGNLKRHLTNYSFNKLHFKSGEDSVMNIDQFETLLFKEHGISYRECILPQIKNIIIQSIKACRQNMDDVDGKCFQLLGYDILIDEKFKPWLLEVNMSPACEERTDWLKDYLQAMGTGLLHIVLPKKYMVKEEGDPKMLIKDEVKETDTEIANFEQRWELICLQQYHFNKRDVDQTLEVIGTALDWSQYQLFERFMDRQENQPLSAEIFDSGEEKSIVAQVAQLEIDVEQSEMEDQVTVSEGYSQEENQFYVISVQRAIRAYLLRQEQSRKKRGDCGCGLLFHFSYLHKEGCRARSQSQRKISIKLGLK